MARTLPVFIVGCLCLVGTTAIAQAPDTIRLRGAIEKFDGNLLVVSPSKGVAVVVQLDADFTVQKVSKAAGDDVKPGARIGAQVTTEADGLRAVQIIIFPETPSANSTDSQASKVSDASLMIAEVMAREQTEKGPVITVQYGEGQRRISLSPDTQIWKAFTGGKDDLRSGMSVSLSATRRGGEVMSTNKLTVSQGGLTPPL